MIVKMKKVTILVSEKHRQDFLIRLRQLGIVHIKNINKPSADEMSLLKEELDQANKALDILRQYGTVVTAVAAHREDIKVLDEIREIVSLYKEKEEKKAGLERVEAELNKFKPWGAFDLEDIRYIEAKGISVRLYRADKKAFKKISNTEGMFIISEDNRSVYLAHISQNSDEGFPFEKVTLPEASFGYLYDSQEAIEKRIGDIESILKSKTHAVLSIREHVAALEKRLIFLDVKHGMQEEKGFSYLQGFCPQARVKDIAKLCRCYGFGYLAEIPDNPDETPTLIENPRWIRIIDPVFKFINTIPGYNECDISLWFLIFLSIFFAMLIGDAGYGFLFVAATFFLERRLKKVPKEPFRLMYLLSFATIVWGAVTGTWFGVERIAKLPFLNSLVIPRLDSFAEGNENFIIYLCFFIGVIQLSIAHLINAFRVINSVKALLVEIGWISILWGMFFLAGLLVMDRPLPSFAGYLIAIGTVLVFLFSTSDKNILKGIVVSLINIPLKIISSFSDIISYLRLFAVGYASLMMASSFNNMALQLGFNNIFSTLGTALILFFGHALNITLGLMAVLIHGVRLNMLEFSGHIGMEWSGRKYTPFCEKESDLNL